MKIKLIALAVAALVSGAANAAIDSGSSSGNGALLFTAWDANSSYTLNTGFTIDSFGAAATAGTLNYSFTDALLTNWLSGTTGAVNWTIFANDQVGAQRSINTTDGSNAGVTLGNGPARAATNNNSLYVDNLLNTGPFSTAGVIEAVSTNPGGTAQSAYTGSSSLVNGGSGYAYNFNSNGSLANDSYATGLGVISINTSNAIATTKSVYAAYASAGTAVHAWVGADKTFNIGTVAAVPEADSLAMLLAGMGLVGSIARRRNRKTA